MSLTGTVEPDRDSQAEPDLQPDTEPAGQEGSVVEPERKSVLTQKRLDALVRRFATGDLKEALESEDHLNSNKTIRDS